MLKKRLNITISASNFLKKYKCYKSSVKDLYFIQDHWSKGVSQTFTLNISYRIGDLKASVKKTERSISNDDVKSNGNSE